MLNVKNDSQPFLREFEHTNVWKSAESEMRKSSAHLSFDVKYEATVHVISLA